MLGDHDHDRIDAREMLGPACGAMPPPSPPETVPSPPRISRRSRAAHASRAPTRRRIGRRLARLQRMERRDHLERPADRRFACQPREMRHPVPRCRAAHGPRGRVRIDRRPAPAVPVHHRLIVVQHQQRRRRIASPCAAKPADRGAAVRHRSSRPPVKPRSSLGHFAIRPDPCKARRQNAAQRIAVR